MRYYQPPQQQVVRIGNPQQQAQNVAFHNNLMNQMYQYMMQAEGMKSQALQSLYNTEFYDPAVGQKIEETAQHIGSLDMGSPLRMSREISEVNRNLGSLMQSNRAHVQARKNYDALRLKYGDDIVIPEVPSIFDGERIRSVEELNSLPYFNPSRIDEELKEMFKDKTAASVHSHSKYPLGDGRYMDLVNMKTGLSNLELEDEFVPFFGDTPNAKAFERVADRFSTHKEYRDTYMKMANGDEKEAMKLAANDMYTRAKNVLGERISTQQYIDNSGASSNRGRGAETTGSSPTPDLIFPATPGLSEENERVKKLGDSWDKKLKDLDYIEWAQKTGFGEGLPLDAQIQSIKKYDTRGLRDVLLASGQGNLKTALYELHQNIFPDRYKDGTSSMGWQKLENGEIKVNNAALVGQIAADLNRISGENVTAAIEKKQQELNEVVSSPTYQMLTTTDEFSRTILDDYTGANFPKLIEYWEGETNNKYNGETQDQIFNDLGVRPPLSQREAFEAMKNYEIKNAIQHNTLYEIPIEGIEKKVQKSISGTRLSGEGITEAYEMVEGKKVKSKDSLKQVVGTAKEVLSLHIVPADGSLEMALVDANGKARNVIIPSTVFPTGISDNLSNMGEFMQGIIDPTQVTGETVIGGQEYKFEKYFENGEIKVRTSIGVHKLKDSNYTPEVDYDSPDLLAYARELDFLQFVESGRDSEGALNIQTQGYIPKQDGKIMGVNGVTVGIGIDLGQQSETQLKNDGVPEEILEKVKPYIGLKLGAADAKLQQQPLNLTREEATILSRKVQSRFIKELESNLEGFKDIPAEAKAVILSLTYQYGHSGRDREFKHVVNNILTGNYSTAAAELETKPQYTHRRSLEAQLLRSSNKNYGYSSESIPKDKIEKTYRDYPLASIIHNLNSYVAVGLGYSAKMKPQDVDPFN